MDITAYSWLIVFIPLGGFLLNGLFGKHLGERIAGIAGTCAPALSFILSAMLFLRFTGTEPHAPFETELFTWFSAGRLDIRVAYLFDTLSIVMILVVTGVGTLIHVYSIGYMKDDKGFTRYFAYLNLFIFFMLNLVLANNLLLMFLGWEGVGLCSYLLIGYYYDTDYAPPAGLKAFVVNRIGDAGFLIGIFLVIANFGTLHFVSLANSVTEIHVSGETMTAITLLFFLGATGKSAQIPLYVWLPDAMAGPTPVSALIHAATMVTSGVYMIARMSFMYTMSPAAMAVVASIGALTALFAATIGIMQMDIKKVLAYSTVSQLGYMFIAAGVGAFSAGIFHLVTHAFFKALLFLCAGSVIYAMHHEQDIRKMGGLRRKLPVTWFTFLMGTLAIAGIPLFSGFFSKDEILWKAYNYSIFIWLAGVTAAAITSFYMFRLLFLTFHGEERFHESKDHAVHESPAVMTFPLAVLAVLSVSAGIIGVPHILDYLHTGNIFSDFLSRSVTDLPGAHYGPHVEWNMMLLSVAAALAGFCAAYIIYRRRGYVPGEDSSITGIRKLLFSKYYVDEFYRATVISGTLKLAGTVYRYFDILVIDGIVNGTGKILLRAGERLRRLQTGVVHDYMLSMMLGVVILLACIIADMVF